MKKCVEVTAKWHPGHVSPPGDEERNCEVSVEVLVYTNHDFYCKARYDYKYKEWYITEGEDLDGDLCWEEDEHVVCWMYFPKPPKEVLKK